MEIVPSLVIIELFNKFQQKTILNILIKFFNLSNLKVKPT